MQHYTKVTRHHKYSLWYIYHIYIKYQHFLIIYTIHYTSPIAVIIEMY